MLTRRRRAFVAALVALLLLLPVTLVTTAYAQAAGSPGDGWADDNGDGSFDLGAGIPGSGGPRPGDSPAGRVDETGSSSERSSDCRGVPVGRSAVPTAQRSPDDNGPGQYYQLVCPRFTLPEGPLYFWVPFGASLTRTVVALVDPAVLARQAYDQLVLPHPELHLSPPATRDQVVRFPTWMWVSRASWRTHTESVSVPGITVTVTARPAETIWRMGDGRTVHCTGPGTIFDPAKHHPEARSPDCGHLYRVASAQVPGERFQVTATIRWHVTWTVTGAAGGGTFPDTLLSVSVPVRVVEYQALNRR